MDSPTTQRPSPQRSAAKQPPAASRPVTFLHAADLHLGASFTGVRNTSPAWAARLIDSIGTTFQRIVDTAIQEDVDFVVLSGDIFDTPHPSYSDYALFAAGMEQLCARGIPVYCIPGNHDPEGSIDGRYGTLPPNVVFLGGGRARTVPFPDDACPAVLLTAPGSAANLQTREEVSAGFSGESFVVGVLHTGLDIDLSQNAVSRSELVVTGVDYWACGHIHKPMVYPSSENAAIAFPGSPQGRGAGEVGDHGVLMVTLRKGAPTQAEFVPLAEIAWSSPVVDVSAAVTVDEVKDLVRAAFIAEASSVKARSLIGSATLTGRTHLAPMLDAATLEEVRMAVNAADPFLYVDAINSEVRRARSQAGSARAQSAGFLPTDSFAEDSHSGRSLEHGVQAPAIAGVFPSYVREAAERARAGLTDAGFAEAGLVEAGTTSSGADAAAPEAAAAGTDATLAIRNGFAEKGIKPPALDAETVSTLIAEAEEAILDLLEEEVR